MILIPVDSVRSWSTFDVKIDDDSYRISVQWNSLALYWSMNIEGLTNDVRLTGLALVSGADLLSPFAILEMGRLFVADLELGNTDPDRDSLGKRHVVVYLSRGENVDVL